MSEDHPEVPPDSKLITGPADSGDMDNMNLLASVFVKVEVMDEDDHDNDNDVFIKNEPKVEATEAPSEKTKKKYKKATPQPLNLKCNVCDYRCARKQTLKTHMYGHSATKPYTCTHCDYSTIYPLSLKRHIFVQHECKESETARKNLPTYKCTICKYTTNFKWNLSSHQRKHELAKQYQCPSCSFTTAYKYNFEKHNRKHLSESGSNYCCDKCPFTTKFEGHIVRHLAKVHFEISEKASRCDFCSFSTRIKWRLNKHVNRSREETPVFCPICTYQTNYRCALREHKLSHTDSQINQRWLDNLFKAEAKTELHNVKIPKDQALKVIETCKMQSKETDTGVLSETTKDIEDLKEKLLNDSYYTYNENPQDIKVNYSQETEHERNNHYRLDPTCEVEWRTIQVIESPDEDRPFQCMTCTYKAKFKASVQRHYQRHHTSANRPYKCINCDFCTKTKDQICLHNKRSKSEFLLTCKLCSFSTPFKCQYALHEKAHMAFKCVYCDYACRKKHDIYKHFTVVHIENKLKCSQCDYKATRKESLLVHQTIHTGKKPFQCQHCSYTSVRRQLLENHIIRFHSSLKEEKVLDEDKIESLRKPLVENLESNFNHSSF